jgi:hypothetical protein
MTRTCNVSQIENPTTNERWKSCSQNIAKNTSLSLGKETLRDKGCKRNSTPNCRVETKLNLLWARYDKKMASEYG